MRPRGKRVYKAVAVETRPEGFGVKLDARLLRSPAKCELVLPGRALAQAVAEEWAKQGEEILPETMPLTAIACTCLDRIARARDQVIGQLTAYGDTELLCYRASHPRVLAERQASVWQPLLDWAMQSLDARLEPVVGLMPKPQPVASLEALRRAVASHDDWALAALSTAVAASGSLVVALALSHGRICSDEAFEAAELDASFQIERWGEDAEAQARRAIVRRDLAAAERFFDLLRR